MHNPLTVSDTIADQVRHHRTRLGLNREQLAQRCADLGAPDLTYAAITNIETGRRNKDGKRRRDVSVDELLVLGLALAVPPLLLAVPLGTRETVPTVPGTEQRDPSTAWQWITGQAMPTLAGPTDGRYYADPRPIGDNGPKWSAAWSAAAHPATFYPEFERRRLDVVKTYRRAENTANDPTTDRRIAASAQTDYFRSLEQLAYLINDMARAGLTLPDVPDDWIEDMQGLAMLDPDTFTHQKGTE